MKNKNMKASLFLMRIASFFPPSKSQKTKEYSKFLKLVLILCLGFFFSFSGKADATTYYVSNCGTIGDDANNGTSISTPWLTINKINTSTFAAGDSILLNSGCIWKEQLTVPSSGSAASPITFGVYGSGDKPIIQPTTQLSDWTQVGSTDVYYASLAVAPTQVFLNDGYIQPSHWPTAAGNPSPTFAYPTSNSANATHLTDTNISFDPTGSTLNIYSDEFTQRVVTVTGWNADTHTMTMNTTTTAPNTTMRYYLSGLLSFVTENTWAYDVGNQRLYVWKNGGGNPGVIEASTGLYGIYGNLKQYITVNGIHVRYAASHGIYFYHTSFLQGTNIINCESNYNGGDGIRTHSTSSSPTNTSNLINNIVDHNRGNGLFSERLSGNITGNLITNAGGVNPQLPGMWYGISTNRNSGTTAGSVFIDNNTITGVAEHGIANTSNNVTITNNIITNTNLLLPDGGGIYNGGLWSNVLVANNTLTNTGFGIYFDENMYNSTARNNTVTGGTVGGHMHKTANITMTKNKFIGPFTMAGVRIANYSSTVAAANTVSYNIIDCVDNTKPGIYVSAKANALNDFLNNTIVNSSIGVEIGVNLASVVNRINNNIFHNNTVNILTLLSNNIVSSNYNLFSGTGSWSWLGSSKSTFDLWKTASLQDAQSINANPLLTSSTDYHLLADSPAINAGTNLGLTSDYASNLVPSGPFPEIGAYEFVDSTAPTTTTNIDAGIYHSVQSLTFNCSDGSGMGCYKIYYTNNGDIPTTESTEYSGVISIPVTTTFKFFSEDKNFNSENYQTKIYTIDATIPPDTTAPTGGSFLINSGATQTTSTSVTLNIICPTDSWTPVQIAWGNTASPTNWEGCATSETLSLPTGNGDKTVYVRFKDGGDNLTADLNQTINLNEAVVATTVSSGSSHSSGTYNATKVQRGNSTDYQLHAAAGTEASAAGVSNIFFADTKDSQFHAAIWDLKRKGIISGYTDGKFKPYLPLNRAEALKIIMGAAGKVPYGDSCFKDISKEWFVGYVCIAKEKGIINGYMDKTFRPDQKINVAEALKITLKAFGITTREVKKGEAWFTPFMEYAKENNLYLNTFYTESTELNREDLAELVYRIMGK